jgi:hypothetical protein
MEIMSHSTNTTLSDTRQHQKPQPT